MMREPDYQNSDGSIRLYRADCRDVLPLIEPVATCITDPPYGLEFMGVAWDTFSDRPKGKARTRNEWGDFGSREHARHPSERAKIMRNKAVALQEFTASWAPLVLQSLLPGALLLSFGGTRTYHRMTCAIEDAGFEVRDCLMWLYGSGFPKSLDVSKAIDKAAGAEREVVGQGPKLKPMNGARYGSERPDAVDTIVTAPATAAAAAWSGWGTALKPAWEPIVLAMKPLDGTFAENAQRHGVAGLNIDGSRLPVDPGGKDDSRLGGKGSWGTDGMAKNAYGKFAGTEHPSSPLGRWPANVVLDAEAGAMLDEQAGPLTSGTGAIKRSTGSGYQANAYGKESRPVGTPNIEYGDTGGASRFFYCAKADESDRRGSKHPTVKPLDLIKWLCKLTLTPTGGTVLDPFMGSGTTMEACYELRRPFIGIEREQSYFDDVVSRAKEMSAKYSLLERIAN